MYKRSVLTHIKIYKGKDKPMACKNAKGRLQVAAGVRHYYIVCWIVVLDIGRYRCKSPIIINTKWTFYALLKN